MIKSTFMHLFKINGAVRLGNKILFRKPLELYDLDTDESIYFKKFDEAMAYRIGDETIQEKISNASIKIFEAQYDGGNGAKSNINNKEFKFSHENGSNEKRNDWNDFPARVNVDIKNPEKTLDAFRKLHVNSGIEHAFVVDEKGFVVSYVHGMKHSVMVMGGRNQMVYHNHPGGGAFSDGDMISTATTGAKGIVASTPKGDYVFIKGTHFKANKFVKAVKNARPTGKSYDDAIDKWLKANAKKFGYKYYFRKAK